MAIQATNSIINDWQSMPRGLRALVLNYYAPMTCDVVKNHKMYHKSHQDSELRFDYVALVRDFESLADLGKIWEIAEEVDRIIREFALTRFSLAATCRSIYGSSTKICTINLLDNLEYVMILKARNTPVQVDLSPYMRRSKEEFDAYPKVHTVLQRLELMSELDEHSCSKPTKKEEGKSSDATLTDNQVSSSSNGQFYIYGRRRH